MGKCQNPCDMYELRLPRQTYMIVPLLVSLVPRPTPFFSVLRFPLTIIHGCRRAAKTVFATSSVYYCQWKPKNRKNRLGLETRLTFSVAESTRMYKQSSTVQLC